MAIFRKAHSRSKPVVETQSITHGISYVDGERRYTASLLVSGGPPYTHFEMLLSTEEMLTLAIGWLKDFQTDRNRSASALPNGQS